MLLFIVFWILLCFLALILMNLSENRNLYFSDILKFINIDNLFVFILSVFIILLYLPLTITHLLSEVLGKK